MNAFGVRRPAFGVAQACFLRVMRESPSGIVDGTSCVRQATPNTERRTPNEGQSP